MTRFQTPLLSIGCALLVPLWTSAATAKLVLHDTCFPGSLWGQIRKYMGKCFVNYDLNMATHYEDWWGPGLFTEPGPWIFLDEVHLLWNTYVLEQQVPAHCECLMWYNLKICHASISGANPSPRVGARSSVSRKKRGLQEFTWGSSGTSFADHSIFVNPPGVPQSCPDLDLLLKGKGFCYFFLWPHSLAPPTSDWPTEVKSTSNIWRNHKFWIIILYYLSRVLKP